MTEEQNHESNTCINMLWSPLPQPTDASRQYCYIPYNQLEATYFTSSRLPEETLCWVLKSKGKLKKRNKGASTASCCDEISEPVNENNKNDGSSDDGGDEEDHEMHGSPHSNTRTELFMRARVVSDDEEESDTSRRVLIRYPKGSTYRVKICNLIPVLEADVVKDNIVLVIPETSIYRRAAVVHTCVGECFLEIGCDYGLTVDRVRRALSEVRNVPRKEDNGLAAAAFDKDKCFCLGIDKSQESIDIAVERYPNTFFSLEDALTKEGSAKLRLLCQEKLVAGYPSVVAVDINGNRDLPAVLQCLENLMQAPDDSDWKLPRLIIVKSRQLYAQVCNRIKTGLQC